MAAHLLGNQLKLGSNRLMPKLAAVVVLAALLALCIRLFVLDQQHYLVPDRAVAAGESLNQVSWNSVSANLGNLHVRYLLASKRPAGFASQTLEAGQLVPNSSISPLKPGQIARVVVSTKTQLGQGIRTGAKVAIWSAEKLQNNQFDAPRKIVANAVVARVIKQQGMFSAASQQVELMIPPIQTPIVLSAMATDSTIFLVAVQ